MEKQSKKAETGKSLFILLEEKLHRVLSILKSILRVLQVFTEPHPG